MKKKIIIGVVILVIVAIVVGLVVARNNNKNTNDGTTKIKVSEVTRSVFYAPQYVAISNGYFKDENLDIEITTGQGADKVMTAVLAGQSDIGFARTGSCNLCI